MKIKHFAIIALILAISIGFGCRANDSKQNKQLEVWRVEANLGQEIAVKRGQDLVIGNENLTINFAAVINDSRCPVNADCVWEGDAIVILYLKKQDGEEKSVVLHANRKFVQTAKYEQYEIKLVHLDRENIATLIVSKQ